MIPIIILHPYDLYSFVHLMNFISFLCQFEYFEFLHQHDHLYTYDIHNTTMLYANKTQDLFDV